MNHDFKDAEHYASTIRGIIIEEATRVSDDPAMPEELVAYWAENMYNACYKAYNDYIIGKRDDYRLSDIESYEQYEKAGLQFTQELVNGLVDRDLLEVSVGPGGDLLYSTTNKGSEVVDLVNQFELDKNLNTKKRGRPRKK
jgi:hypothetical protein